MFRKSTGYYTVTLMRMTPPDTNGIFYSVISGENQAMFEYGLTMAAGTGQGISSKKMLN